MGQEIPSSKFTAKDFIIFRERLRAETELLGEYFHNNQLSSPHNVGGFEVEAWLVDKNATPSPINEEFLKQMNDPLVVHELAVFNVELNVEPQALKGNALQVLHDELNMIWDQCRDKASELDADMMTIGTHPGVKEEQLSLKYMSDSERYRALNEQVFNLREGQPIALHIRGHDHLHSTHDDVMTEAGTTSLQIHLQVSQENAVAAYNASQFVSAPLVAVSANSPYLFGLDLWDESRIPLFQQSVNFGADYAERVTFSHKFVQDSLFSCFEENLESYPILIPILFDDDVDKFSHLRFHNGTVWRWNRPLLGVNESGDHHLRIENRVVPSGPTVIDMMANAAFYWGLVQALTQLDDAIEDQIDFPVVRQNFYNACRYSLESSIYWLDGELHPVYTLLLQQLLPMAWEGLRQLDIDQADRDKYINIIEKRIISRQNGAIWQRKWVAKYGKDMDALSRAYLKHQHSQLPVHEWTI